MGSMWYWALSVAAFASLAAVEATVLTVQDRQDGGGDGDSNNNSNIPENCTQPSDRGRCKAYFENWYYNVETSQCEVFVYGGCEGNGNNYPTLAECIQNCTARIIGKTVDEVFQEYTDGVRGRRHATHSHSKDYGRQVEVNAWKWGQTEFVDFETNSTGGWALSNFSTVAYVMIDAPADDNDSDDDKEEEEEGGETPAESIVNTIDVLSKLEYTPSVGIVPQFDEADPGRNATMVRTVSLKPDYNQMVEMAVRIQGYDEDAEDPLDNPFFSVELVKKSPDFFGVRREFLLFDVRDYGDYFGRMEEFSILRLSIAEEILPYGNYDLVLTARRGAAEDSLIIVDNVTLTENPRLTIAIAERLDNAADGDPNAVENPNNGGGGVGGEEEETTPTPPPKDGTTPEPPEKPEEEEPPVSKTSKAAVIILILLVIALAIALAGVSYKYYQLRKEMVGNYSVTRAPQQQQQQQSPPSQQPAFDNPLYSGQHTSADDRYYDPKQEMQQVGGNSMRPGGGGRGRGQY